MRKFLICFSFVFTGYFAEASSHRIVSLDPSISEILSAIELTDFIVGVSNQCNYPLDINKKNKIGDYNNPNIEKIIATKPSHILSLKLGRPLLKKQLEQLDLKQIQFEAKSLQDYLSLLNQLNKEFPSSSRTPLKSFLKNKAEISKIQIIKTYLAILNTEPLIIVGNNNFLSEALSLCGLKNVFSEESAWPQISIEKLVSYQADYIFNLSAEEKVKPNLLKLIHKDSQYFIVNKDEISRLGPRLLPEVLRICKALKAKQVENELATTPSFGKLDP